MSLPAAHAGHWLISLAFAGPPLAMIGGLIALGVRERRRS
jgi:hypothetical protein